MDPAALHLEVRNAIVLADELGRHEHAQRDDTLAGHLAAVRSALGELERALGRGEGAVVRPGLASRLNRLSGDVRERLDAVPRALRPRVELFLSTVERVAFAERRPAAPLPAKRLLGGLPLARLIPQPVHSAIDYAAAAAMLASAVLARTRRARFVGRAAAAKLGGAAMLTDAPLALVRLLRIELHEALDHALAITTLLAPSVLGYRRRDRLAARIQTGAALGLLVVSLVTDYRAELGVARPVRARGRRQPRRRVPEAQRPLEGLANRSIPQSKNKPTRRAPSEGAPALRVRV
jgi:hypothetical protein